MHQNIISANVSNDISRLGLFSRFSYTVDDDQIKRLVSSKYFSLDFFQKYLAYF